jgi:acetyl-CoA acyltransferase 1
MQRLESLNQQVQPNATMNLGSVQQKSDEDVVIVSMARTAMTRAKKGPQKDTAPEVMLKVALKSAIEKSGIDAKQVDDIVIGNVLQGGAGSTTSRMAQLLAGIPHTTSLQGINRLCSSGLQAVATVANQIRAHEIDIGIGGGVESMSMYSMMDMVDPSKVSD